MFMRTRQQGYGATVKNVTAFFPSEKNKARKKGIFGEGKNLVLIWACKIESILQNKNNLKTK